MRVKSTQANPLLAPSTPPFLASPAHIGHTATFEKESEEKAPFVLSLSKDKSASSPDDTPDCYYEPLNPDDQAIFNYNTLMESGEYKEGEISIVPPSEAARRDYIIALKNITEAAAADGVPLLPNPLAGKLRAPTIRSP